MMLTVGDAFPAFNLKAVKPGRQGLDPKDGFTILTNESDEGRWKVVFFWPKDFSLICPTEILGFHALAHDFAEREAALYGVSLDSELAHQHWRRHDERLRDLAFPLLSDLRRELSEACGVLDREEGVPLRATFILDPEGVIRFVSVNDRAVGRNPEEALRVLDALQTDALCPCNWKRGDAILKPSR